MEIPWGGYEKFFVFTNSVGILLSYKFQWGQQVFKKSWNRPQIQTTVCGSELRGRPRRNVIIPYEKTSYSSNDSNDETITDNESDEGNY